MKIYKTQEEVEKDIKNGVLAIEGDVKFECSISIEAKIIVSAGNISAWNISAWNISAWNISAGDISAGNISAGDISAWNISAGDISAGNISARDISARNISAWNISAWNISAGDISYYAFCVSYNSIRCVSIKARRDNHQEPVCLDGKLEIIPKEKPETGKKVKIRVADGHIIEGEIIEQ